MKKIKKWIIIIFLLVIYIYVSYFTLLPNSIILIEGEKINFKNIFGVERIESTNTFNDGYNTNNIEFKLLGFHVKNVNVTTIENAEVVPIGKIIGLKLYTDGVLVVGFSEIEDINKNITKPYEKTDIKEGDTILKINGEKVEDIEALKNIIKKSNGEKLNFTILRDNSILSSSIIPTKTNKNEYKIGIWVKDAATGVGTLTFYEPISKKFAALGHGITDNDTESLINIESGELVTSRVINVQKGEEESPGEIRGTILNQQTIGSVKNNSSFGIYGILNNLTSLNIDTSKKYKVALRNEIELGEAYILCSIDNSNVPKEYKIDIEKIYFDNDFNNKSMLIRVTDKKLIEKTGGIIRGLSGAPIIQNNKFVGAVTNVLVSNPEIGYAIFGDLMVKEMQK